MREKRITHNTLAILRRSLVCGVSGASRTALSSQSSPIFPARDAATCLPVVAPFQYSMTNGLSVHDIAIDESVVVQYQWVKGVLYVMRHPNNSDVENRLVANIRMSSTVQALSQTRYL